MVVKLGLFTTAGAKETNYGDGVENRHSDRDPHCSGSQLLEPVAGNMISPKPHDFKDIVGILHGYTQRIIDND